MWAQAVVELVKKQSAAATCGLQNENGRGRGAHSCFDLRLKELFGFASVSHRIELETRQLEGAAFVAISCVG